MGIATTLMGLNLTALWGKEWKCRTKGSACTSVSSAYHVRTRLLRYRELLRWPVFTISPVRFSTRAASMRGMTWLSRNNKCFMATKPTTTDLHLRPMTILSTSKAQFWETSSRALLTSGWILFTPPNLRNSAKPLGSIKSHHYRDRTQLRPWKTPKS